VVLLITWYMSSQESTDDRLVYPLHVTFLPLVGARSSWVIRGDDDVARRNIRQPRWHVTVIVLPLSLLAWSSFDPASRASSLRTSSWLGGLMTYHMGVDGISMPFVMLTTLPSCRCASLQAGTSPSASRNT
jgi:NADH-quinone oxidoreductase subunit M